MGSIVIGGMAALLICTFLGPRFIEILREREFGQHIREEGPEGHHGKAGTPTMGGLVLFVAVSGPFLVLRGQPAASLAGIGTAPAPAAPRLPSASVKLKKKRHLRRCARDHLC